METIEAIRWRRSIRRFKADPVDLDLLKEVIAAAYSAPSAHGNRPWHIVVARDENLRKQLSETHQWSAMLANAPVALVMCADRTPTMSELFWIEDTAAATENLMLAACDRGLGTCWIAVRGVERDDGTAEDYVRKVLGIPDNIGVLCLVALGYPEVKAAPHRVQILEGRLHFGRFGQLEPGM